MKYECTGAGGRGCTCEWHTWRRNYQREHARQIREAELLERNRASRTCQKRHGPGVCGGILEERTDGAGRMLLVCPRCERASRGMCLDCARPVDGKIGKSLRCAEHKRLARQEQVRRSQLLNKEKIRARARRSYQENPDVRRRRNEYKRLYRKANPEKVREYKRAEAMRQSERRLEYHRRYNARYERQRRKRELARAAYYRDNPVRPQPSCKRCGVAIEWTPLAGARSGRPPTKCDGCCDRYELARRLKVRAARAATEPTPARERPRVRPITVKHPMPVRYAESGERLCVTPDCDIVVTHRKKKCSRCRAAEQRRAAELLERHRGRGRRTDQERVA